MRNHRPEDAHRLIEPLMAGGYRKAWRLARAVVPLYLARAAKTLDHNNLDAAWRDLMAAESLNTGDGSVAEFRRSLSRLALVQVRTQLEAGEPVTAIMAVGRLRERGVLLPELDRLEAVAQDWVLAAELADRGEFLRASAELERIAPKLPCPTTGLDRFRENIEDRHMRFRDAVGRLYDAAETRQWRDALEAAEEVLIAAPDHREAKAIRGKAWFAASPPDGPLPESAEAARPAELTGALFSGAPNTHSTLPLRPLIPGPPPPSSHHNGIPALPKRFLLWVDGVGGYLVCLSNRITFGQATADGPVDVPLFADVSRLHAELSRDGEGYVVESNRGVLVNGKATNRTLLTAGDRVTLGATCQFLFHKPVSVSSTAKLELTSGHRLPVAADAILLMANELILGAAPNTHVVLPGVPNPVLIYRSKDGLGIRVPGGPFRIDDRPHHDRAPLPLPAVVTADNFTLAVEPVTGRL